jgi:hypothetical protein
MPAVSETAAIRNFTREIDAEVARKELIIDRLLCEVAELRRCSEQHKALIAPIRRVPPEVMAEIFLQLAEIEAETGSCASYLYDYGEVFEKKYIVRPFRDQAPLIFGRICRDWRSIALSTPRLWNSISLECRNRKIRSNISLCDMWLKRSGSLPLSIRLYRHWILPSERDIITQQTIDHWQELIRIILPYAQRWRFLDLANVPDSFYDSLYGLLPDYAPMLEALCVSHDDDLEPANARSTPRIGIRFMRKLRILYLDSLGGTDITAGGEWQTLPWSQLTHIDVGECSAYDCLHILGQALAAVACKFTVTRDSPLQHLPISHSGLRTLKIVVDANLLLLWSCLTCSVLSTLSIESENAGMVTDHTFFQGLPSFITRTDKSIKDFTMQGSSLTDNQFASCLADMPRLHHLRVSEGGSGVQFTNQIWESLTWGAAQDSPSPLIPKLKSLYVAGTQQCSHKSVVRMLKSRLEMADNAVAFSPLTAVTLWFWRNVSDSACKKLRAFGKLGLSIIVEVEPDDDDQYGDGSEASDAEDEESDEGDSEGPSEDENNE